MRREKHPLAVAAFLITIGTQAAQASNLTPSEQARAFATCAGRLSALATRLRATRDPDYEATGRMLGDFELMLEATLPHTSAAGVGDDQARYWRTVGWLEIAHLLRTRHYSPDEARVARAKADMHRRISTCVRMILPG